MVAARLWADGIAVEASPSAAGRSIAGVRRSKFRGEGIAEVVKRTPFLRRVAPIAAPDLCCSEATIKPAATALDGATCRFGYGVPARGGLS